jgi:hypothetical protein
MTTTYNTGLSLEDAIKWAPKGWAGIITKFYSDLEAFGVYHAVSVVKEKFGGLRIYLDYVGADAEITNKIQDLIDDAEEASYGVCSECSAPGELRDDLSWILTLCDSCHGKIIHAK